MRALYVAASGMNAQQTRIDTVANNLANTNTTAFKASRGAFQDTFYQELATGSRGTRADLGGGVQLSGLEKDHAIGAMRQTDDPLHVALDGPGFVAVEAADGQTVYTRDGAFRLDADGNLTNSSGLRVAGDIQIPEDTEQVVIEADGTVLGVMAGDTRPTTLGQLEIVSFANPSGLKAIGGNLYQASPESGDAVPDYDVQTKVVQGNLESSNVDVAEELIELVMAQRSYELNSKVVQAADEAMQTAAALRR
jgi:flagellar basal-body rod protein FlgG